MGVPGSKAFTFATRDEANASYRELSARGLLENL